MINCLLGPPVAITQRASSYVLLLFLSFLPARRYASAGLCDSDVSVRPSVCLSVRLSAARRYCA